MKKIYNIPSYSDALELSSRTDVFYESKSVVDGYSISTFNYRLAQFSDFENPIKDSELKGYEMRGITYVFNTDGSLFNRHILLDKFFNLNQVESSGYSVVKDFKIKSIYNKEDGSIASFVRLPNGKVLGKSKMSFESDQAIGITRVYNTNEEVKNFVDWTLDNGIDAVFEYVSPMNRIVLRYLKEELILLRLRDNKTGEYLDLNDYLDKIGSIRIAPSETGTLDELIERSKVEIDREGWVVLFDNGVMIKLKTEWYFLLHNLLTEDVTKENVLIGYILKDEIDDVIAQIPEDEKELHERIEKIISIVRKEVSKKIVDINKSYENYLTVGSRKEYAIQFRNKDINFGQVMQLVKADELKKLSREEILEIYESYEKYENIIKNCDVYELAKAWVSNETNKLFIAREWLEKLDETLFFKETEE
jgi:T4 RnlA family RNA ligase